MGNDSINRVSRQRVYIDEHLQWCSDVDHLANKILSGLAGLRRSEIAQAMYSHIQEGKRRLNQIEVEIYKL